MKNSNTQNSDKIFTDSQIPKTAPLTHSPIKDIHLIILYSKASFLLQA